MFKDRKEAGILLAKRLTRYRGSKTVVYTIPRGGITVAFEIAKYLSAPLDLVIAHKIGHPGNPEYAIAATSESGRTIGNPQILESIDKEWLKNAIKIEQQEIKRKRQTYLQSRKQISAENKTAILVDDGVATGLTLRVAIQELKNQHPAKLIVAVPVIPEETANIVKQKVDELVALTIPTEHQFLGAVGSYYETFPQVEDEEVIDILGNYQL